MVRLSILEVTWKEMRVGKFALMVPGDDVDRRALRRQDDVDAGGARHLRETLDGALNVLAGDHHEVGHLVDDHHQIGQRLEIEIFLLVDRLAGFLVVAGVHRAP